MLPIFTNAIGHADIEAGFLITEDFGSTGFIEGDPPRPIAERYEAATDMLAALHRGPLQHALQEGAHMRQRARGALHAARPAAEHEDVRVERGVGGAHHPWPAVLRQVRIDLVHPAVELGFGHGFPGPYTGSFPFS